MATTPTNAVVNTGASSGIERSTVGAWFRIYRFRDRPSEQDGDAT
jgi:hypothetical protein